MGQLITDNRGGYRGRGQQGSERRQGGQDCGSFRGGQNYSQSQPFKGKADQQAPSAPLDTKEAADPDPLGLTCQQFWNQLRSLGEDMRKYDRQPTKVLIKAWCQIRDARDESSAKPISLLQEPQPSDRLYPTLLAHGGAE